MKLAEPLVVGLLQGSGDLSKSAQELRSYVAPLEHTFDVTIEIAEYTRADFPDLDTGTITLLAGVLPVPNDSTTASRAARSHADLEQRTMARCRTLVHLIEEDHSLIRRARNYLDRLLEESQGTATRDLQEWRTIIGSYPTHRLLRFLTSMTPRASRLRQSCPFFAILSEEERSRLLTASGEDS